MDGRKVMLAGGAFTVAAMLVVGGIVLVDGLTAVADAPGQALAVEAIVVPSPSATATQTPVATPEPVAVPAPVVVPAPAPEDVAPVNEAPQPVVPEEPAVVPPRAATYPPPDPAVDPASAIQRLREWAAAQGWDAARVQGMIDELRAKYGAQLVLPETPVDQTGRQSGSESPHFRFGSKEGQSPAPSAESG